MATKRDGWTALRPWRQWPRLMISYHSARDFAVCGDPHNTHGQGWSVIRADDGVIAQDDLDHFATPAEAMEAAEREIANPRPRRYVPDLRDICNAMATHARKCPDPALRPIAIEQADAMARLTDALLASASAKGE